jgi:hypothetical protein
MNILLMGAGFSRNWGGWLTSELTGNLLGLINDDAELRQRLQSTSAFESVLTDLQAERHISAAHEERCKQLEDAVISSFYSMNLSFADSEFRFSRSAALETDISGFLGRFDSLFTLNQDLLLELHYRPSRDSGHAEAEYPGLSENFRATPYPSHVDLRQRLVKTSSPRPSQEFKLSPDRQPIFKLHGSVDWIQQSGKGMVIIGGKKPDAIHDTPLLAWYYREFQRFLNAGNTRLMVIGYSFHDLHINDLICTAAEHHGLKMFIVDPAGAALVQSQSQGAQIKNRWMLCDVPLIGISQRPLSSTFSDDKLEHGKLLRFFK